MAKGKGQLKMRNEQGQVSMIICNFGRNVKAYRTEEGWSQDEMAEFLDFPPEKMNDMEAGTVDLSYTAITKMAYKMGRSLYSVTTGTMLDKPTDLVSLFFSNVNAVRAPRYVGDAGFDFVLPADVWVMPLSAKRIPLGTTVSVPENCYGLITTRSSADLKNISVSGIVDYGYHDELSITVKNHSWRLLKFEQGERIAQIIFTYYTNPQSRSSSLENRVTGHGSTGR